MILFDGATLNHGFTAYVRDYEVIAELGGTNPGRYSYRFTHCVVANLETRLQDSNYIASWSDTFIDYDRWLEDGAPSGFV